MVDRLLVLTVFRVRHFRLFYFSVMTHFLFKFLRSVGTLSEEETLSNCFVTRLNSGLLLKDKNCSR